MDSEAGAILRVDIGFYIGQISGPLLRSLHRVIVLWAYQER